jgi:hypothetical protein
MRSVNRSEPCLFSKAMPRRGSPVQATPAWHTGPFEKSERFHCTVSAWNVHVGQLVGSAYLTTPVDFFCVKRRHSRHQQNSNDFIQSDRKIRLGQRSRLSPLLLNSVALSLARAQFGGLYSHSLLLSMHAAQRHTWCTQPVSQE